MDKELSIIEAQYPDSEDYGDNGRFFFWMDYACELDEITNFAYTHDNRDELVTHLNGRMKKLALDSAEHDACVAIASTLEESMPDKYKGAFVYE